MPSNREEVIGGIWADGAPDVPVSPVGGVTYADGNLIEEEIQEGWPYSEVVDSSKLNEIMRRVTTLLNLLEVYGTLPWCPYTRYMTTGRCLGSDGQIYKSAQDNNLNHDPITPGSTWWTIDNLAAHAAETNAHGAVSAATPSKIALRDANGDLAVRMVRSEHSTLYAGCNYFMGQAELGSGTNNYVRPMSLAQARNLLTGFSSLSSLKAAPGYTMLPGGLILQWGRYFGGTAGTFNVTMPITFPVQALAAFASRPDGVISTQDPVGAYPYSASLVRIMYGTPYEIVQWLAIGY